MGSILISLSASLLLTLAVELPLAFLLKVRGGKNLLIVVLVNLLTNPVVNYCYYWALRFFAADSIYTILFLAFLELAAVLTEFLFYKLLLSYDRLGKLKLSLLLNAASFAAGLLVSGAIRLLS